MRPSPARTRSTAERATAKRKAPARTRASTKQARPRTATGVAAVPSRPHGRLGLAWGAVTVAAAMAGRPVLALWLAPLAALAALQLARALRRRRRAVHPRLAAAGAAAVVLAAVVGLRAVTVVLVAVPLVALLLARPAGRVGRRRGRRATGDPLGGTFVVATIVGTAAAAPVLVREMGLAETLVLFVLVGAYDAGAYLVGTGAANRWEGPVAGMAAVAAVDVSVAALLVPPFRGASAWVLGGLVAIGAPLGVALATGLTATTARPSAVGRLDSLLVAGPAYAGAIALLLG